jgi:hypothetical protein
MVLWKIFRNWNATSEEEVEEYPCDKYVSTKSICLFRAITINAPVPTVYRWICQIKLAPYSYDWMDNGGKESPRKLIPGTENIKLGQNFMVGPIVEFEKDSNITCISDPKFEKIFGKMSLTYTVRSRNNGSVRIVVKIVIQANNWFERLRAYLLGWGDLIMMRKQLLNIKMLSEGK